MSLKKKLILAALGLALLAAGGTVYFFLAQPRLEVAETVHDFGPVREDERLSHTFVLKNNGSRALEIKDVKADCACTVTNYDKVIPPGGEGSMTLGLKPFSVRGAFAKKTTVFLNDPALPRVVFTLKGESRPLIEVQPGTVIRFKGKAGEDLRQQVRLTSSLPEPWEISRFKTNLPQFLELTLTPAEPGRVYLLEVRQTRQEPGKYQGVIELFTTVPKRPRLLLRVLGEVLPP